MRLTSRALACALLIACCSPLALAAAAGSACAAVFQPGGAPGFDPSRLGSPEKPISMTGPCSVSRQCDYPPPYSISCSGSNECLSGPEYYGWVQCDGGSVYYCSPPPACIGTCYTKLQCWNVCSAGGVYPADYTCTANHCCLCFYD